MKFAAAITCLLVGCSSARGAPPAVPLEQTFEATDGGTHSVSPRNGESHAVVVFFSADCHVLRAHDERLLELVAEYAPRGVRFVAVDSEVNGSVERDRAEAARRGYSFPILLDPDARLARRLGAEYAGYTVVIDRRGEVLYRGGIDSDRVHLRSDATPYLRNVLTDLLSGKPARLAESKALGCALRIR